MARSIKYIALAGGEDHATPIFNKGAGTLSSSQNFECDTGGRYRRIDGYERYDGQQSPSGASYWKLNFDGGQTQVSEGDTVTGATSGATGTALIDGVAQTGTYAGGDADGYLVLTGVSGTFQDDEALQVSGATVCAQDGPAYEKGGSSENHNTWLQAVIEAAIDEITAVPGSGDILGVHTFDGDVYAFRNNAAGTEAVMHKASSSGWSAVSLGEYLDFDAGSDAFSEGETLTGGTSSATATIERVIVQSGDWSTDNAGGYLVLSGVTGTFEDDEAITSAAGSATADGVNTEIALDPDGQFEFVNHNFYGTSSTKSMYGCDGVNNAFGFDGTVFTPIRTGMSTDSPGHITAYKQHLFLTFDGGSLQHSSVGEPFEWDAVTGAAELGLGEQINNLTVMPSDTLAIFGRNFIAFLSGDSSDDWALEHFTRDSGAMAGSVQKFADLLYLDDRGIMTLSTTQDYGDFQAGTISSSVRDLLSAKKTTFLSSTRVKNKDHYRLFYSDKSGINLTLSNNAVVGFTRLKYDHKVCCTCSGEDSSGNEILFFGSSNGMVYQADKGTSFDGEPVEAWVRTWIFALGNPEQKKRFFKYALEKDSGKTEGYWGVDTWGTFDWGSQKYDKETAYLDHTEYGYEFYYHEEKTYATPCTLQGILIHYSEGGLVR